MLELKVKPPRLQFFVLDPVLQQELETGVLPHLPVGEWVFFNTKQPRLDSRLTVVCVSAVSSKQDVLAARRFLDANRPLALIIKSEDKTKWAALSELHHRKAFHFVVGVSGSQRMKDSRFPDFPNVSSLGDISDLIHPGKGVARFIWSVVERDFPEPAIPAMYA